MRKVLVKSSVILVIISFIFSSGCWSYKEINELAIVAGIAIDKGEDGKYIATMEVVNQSAQGKDTETLSKLVKSEGETVFDTIRNTINISGKRLYFSHLKIAVISEEIAREDIVRIIDWFHRDIGALENLRLIVSRERTAAEILSQETVTSPISSSEFDNTLKNQNDVSKAPDITLHEFINKLAAKGISAILPTAKILHSGGFRTAEVGGTAIFKGNKLVGFLDDNETRYLLFVLDEVKGGVIPNKENEGENEGNISLEIFRSDTKVKPYYTDGKLKMNILIDIEASIAENGTTRNNLDKSGRDMIEKSFSRLIEENIKNVIQKVQSQYGADIFGLGKKLEYEMPGVWKEFMNDWNERFRDVGINVQVKISTRNIGISSKNIKVGD